MPVVDSQRVFFAKEQRTLAAALSHYCGRQLEGACNTAWRMHTLHLQASCTTRCLHALRSSQQSAKLPASGIQYTTDVWRMHACSRTGAHGALPDTLAALDVLQAQVSGTQGRDSGHQRLHAEAAARLLSSCTACHMPARLLLPSSNFAKSECIHHTPVHAHRAHPHPPLAGVLLPRPATLP